MAEEEVEQGGGVGGVVLGAGRAEGFAVEGEAGRVDRAQDEVGVFGQLCGDRAAVVQCAGQNALTPRTAAVWFRPLGSSTRRGRNSAVECQLPKLNVAGSIPVARSKKV